MNIKVSKKVNEELDDNEINIIIECKNENATCTSIEKYIQHYIEKRNIIIVKNNYNQLIHLNKNNILKFFSYGKQNYCETIDNKKYLITKKLYEIEKLNNDYIRISKHCIVNLTNIKCFDFNSTRKNNNQTYRWLWWNCFKKKNGGYI